MADRGRDGAIPESATSGVDVGELPAAERKYAAGDPTLWVDSWSANGDVLITRHSTQPDQLYLTDVGPVSVDYLLEQVRACLAAARCMTMAASEEAERLRRHLVTVAALQGSEPACEPTSVIPDGASGGDHA